MANPVCDKRRITLAVAEFNGLVSHRDGDEEVMINKGHCRHCRRCHRTRVMMPDEKEYGSRSTAGYRRRRDANYTAAAAAATGGGCSFGNGGPIEATTIHNTVRTTTTTGTSSLKELHNSLHTSNELLKLLLQRIWRPKEDRNSSQLTLISALRVEINRARQQVDHVIVAQQSDNLQSEMRKLLLVERFERERMEWRRRDREKVKVMRREVEVEKRMRKRADRLNVKLRNEIVKLRKENESLQMKLEEVEKYEYYEEKNGAVEKLRHEHEIYLEMKQRQEEEEEDNDDVLLRDKRGEFLQRRLRSNFIEETTAGGVIDSGSESGSDSSTDVDSIELISMNKLLQTEEEEEEVFKGRRSLCEKIQWETICLPKKPAATSTNIVSLSSKIIDKKNYENGRLSSSSTTTGSGETSTGVDNLLDNKNNNNNNTDCRKKDLRMLFSSRDGSSSSPL